MVVTLTSTITSSSSGTTATAKFAPEPGDILFLPNPLQLTLSATINVWQDVNASSIIPEGYTGALLHIRVPTSADVIWGTRAVGSTDNITCFTGWFNRAMAVVKLNASRNFQLFRNSTVLQAWVVGFFRDDVATLFTNAVDITQPADAWQPVDITSSILSGETAIGAIVDHIPAPGGTGGSGLDNSFGIQPDDQFFINRRSLVTHNHWIQRVVSNRFRTYRTNPNAKTYLIGYFKRGIGFHTGQNDVTPGTTGSYVDLPPVGSGGSAGALYHAFATVNARVTDLRAKGSSWTTFSTNTVEYQSLIPVTTDQAGVAQAIISSTASYNLYRFAWFVPNFSVSIPSTSPVTAFVRVAERFQATTVSATSTVMGIARLARRLQGATVSSISTVIAGIKVSKGLQASVSATSAVVGALRVAKRLQATASSTSVVTATLQYNKRLQASVTSTSTVTAFLRDTRRLQALVASTSTVTATIQYIKQLKASVASASTVTAFLRRTRRLTVIVSSSSTVIAELRVLTLDGSTIALKARIPALNRQDFVVFEGDNRLISFEVTDKSGAVILDDITDIQWRVVRSFVNPGTLISKALGGDIRVKSGTNVFLISLTPTDTMGLQGTYFHEVRLNGGNSLVTAATGRMYVQQTG